MTKRKQVATIAIVSAIAGGLYLLTRKAKAELPPEELPPPGLANLYGTETGFAGGGVKVSIDGLVTYTNSAGYYAFEGLAPGNYMVRFSKDLFETLVLDISLVEGNNELNFRLVLTSVVPPGDELPPDLPSGGTPPPDVGITPPRNELDILSVSLPSSVRAGNNYWPEATVKLVDNTATYRVHLFLDLSGIANLPGGYRVNVMDFGFEPYPPGPPMSTTIKLDSRTVSIISEGKATTLSKA